MKSNVFFQNLVKELNLGYALLSDNCLISEWNDVFENFIFPHKLDNNKSIFDVVDETVGLEESIVSLIQYPKKNIALNNINRENKQNEIAFFDLKILTTGEIENPLICLIQNVTENTNLYRSGLQQKREIEILESILNAKDGFLLRSILGDSKSINLIRDMVNKISLLPTTSVLLQGETGTGKSHVARIIHLNRQDAKKPFVEINCAAIPENLLESELFGYEKGAFTNAISEKAGLLEEAHNGTLFLDEISEMPLSLQSKLLTFLETKRFRRLGSTKEIEVKLRLITATNKNLSELVKTGKFREDLYYRLNVVEIKLPALREMDRDVLIIAGHLLKVFNAEFKKSIEGFSNNAERKLLGYSWPGNVRELSNCIERSIIFCEKEKLDEEDILIKNIQRYDSASEIDMPIKGILLNEVEEQYIKAALRMANGNKSKAAHLLGLSRDTLRYRIEKYKL